VNEEGGHPEGVPEALRSHRSATQDPHPDGVLDPPVEFFGVRRLFRAQTVEGFLVQAIAGGSPLGWGLRPRQGQKSEMRPPAAAVEVGG